MGANNCCTKSSIKVKTKDGQELYTPQRLNLQARHFLAAKAADGENSASSSTNDQKGSVLSTGMGSLQDINFGQRFKKIKHNKDKYESMQRDKGSKSSSSETESHDRDGDNYTFGRAQSNISTSFPFQ